MKKKTADKFKISNRGVYKQKRQEWAKNPNRPKKGQERDDGYKFWDFSCGKERWISPEKYNDWQAKATKSANEWAAKNPSKSRDIKIKSANKRREPRRLIARAQAYAWKNRNPEKAKEIHKRAQKKRHAKIMIWKKERHKLRCKTDTFYKIKSNMRNRVRMEMKRLMTKKRKSTKGLLGCDWQTLKTHIESQFLPGMTWENHGAYKCGGPMKWNLDHRIPTAHAKDVDTLEKLFHYTNLQPLWAVENIIKSDKILPEFAHLVPVAV